MVVVIVSALGRKGVSVGCRWVLYLPTYLSVNEFL